jgi:hypothetical protein
MTSKSQPTKEVKITEVASEKITEVASELTQEQLDKVSAGFGDIKGESQEDKHRGW